MAHLDPDAEDAIAAMDEAELDTLLARLRPPAESSDPKARAAAALRRHRGKSGRRGPATKEQAAQALRSYAAGDRD